MTSSYQTNTWITDYDGFRNRYQITMTVSKTYLEFIIIDNKTSTIYQKQLTAINLWGDTFESYFKECMHCFDGSIINTVLNRQNSFKIKENFLKTSLVLSFMYTGFDRSTSFGFEIPINDVLKIPNETTIKKIEKEIKINCI